MKSRPVTCIVTVLLVAVILLVVFDVVANQMTGFRIETDRDTCYVGEKVTAFIVSFNDLPFPVPRSVVNGVEFGCTLNGEQLGTVYSAWLNSAGRMYLVPPGSEVWLDPITITPRVNGTLVFTARISMEQLKKYEKQVHVLPR